MSVCRVMHDRCPVFFPVDCCSHIQLCPSLVLVRAKNIKKLKQDWRNSMRIIIIIIIIITTTIVKIIITMTIIIMVSVT